MARRPKATATDQLQREINRLTELAPPPTKPTPLLVLFSFIDDGGSFSVTSVPSFGTVASAHMKKQTVALLRQKSRESLPALLERLESAIMQAFATGKVVDYVNVNPIPPDLLV